MIAHDEDTPGRDRDVELQFGGGIAWMQVRLVQGYAVDRDLARLVAALDGVPADRDHPLDQVLLVVRRQQTDEGQRLLDLLDDDRVVLLRRLLVPQPAAGVLEDHDIPALRLRTEPGRQFVHQDPVVDPDRLFHRP